MELLIPPPPVRLGCSRPIRRRVRASGPLVRSAFALLAVLDEVLERRFRDQLERDRALRARGLAVEGEKSIAVRDKVYNIALDIQGLALALVDTGDALAGARGRRRAACARREAARKRLYRELSRFRRKARGSFRSRPVPRILRGETVRDPWLLVRLAEEITIWAGSRQEPPSGDESWADLAAPAEPPRAELAEALREIDAAEPDIAADREELESVTEAFDYKYLHGARICEQLCFEVGLPTVAGTFRPHLKVSGGFGRPSKQTAYDDHPDLVERFRAALAAGCVILGEPVRDTGG